MSIKEIYKKINHSLKKGRKIVEGDLFVILVIILVGFAGFGLGRLSALEENKFPIRFENLSDSGAAAIISTDNISNSDGAVVASVNGSKYHFPWCSGASRMKEENKIWFSSIEEAKNAGYEPAVNCKGLK